MEKAKRRRNTIPLVEPHYCDRIICDFGVIEEEQWKDILAQIRGTEVKQSYATTYRYFFGERFNLYSVQGRSLVRNRRGDFIAHQQADYHRKYAWLLILSLDEVFGRFFNFTSESRSEQAILQEFNSASGKYLRRWGEWLGKTLYLPRVEEYRSFEESEIPGQEGFWEMLLDAYEHISRESWIAPRRYNVAVGELRIEVCVRYSMLPLSFDYLLSELHRSREYYTELELLGLPPHGLENSDFSSFIVDGSEYFYVVIHTQPEFGS